MTTATAELPLPAGSAAPGRLHRRWWRQLGIDTAFVLVGLPLSVAAFVLVVTGLAVGIGTLVVWVGLPLLALTLLVARGLAAVERMRLPGVLQHEVPSPVYRTAAPDASLVRRLVEPLRDPQCWLDVVHALLRTVVSIPAFVVVVTGPASRWRRRSPPASPARPGWSPAPRW